MVFMPEDDYIVGRKYNITKTDGTKIEKDATYFVIRVDAGQPEQKTILTYARLLDPIDKKMATCIWALARQYTFDAFKNNGIKQRYIIRKKDGTPIDKKAKYFVLRIDDDKEENDLARIVLRVYAQYLEPTKPRMAKQIAELVDCKTWERFGLSQESR